MPTPIPTPALTAQGERVRAAAVFRKPRGLTFSAAAQLMLPALTACAALQAASHAVAELPHILTRTRTLTPNLNPDPNTEPLTPPLNPDPTTRP